MTGLAQQISETPMAPYIGLLRGMSSEQKLVVMAFLEDSLKETAKDVDEVRTMLKPNPFKNFKHANEFTDTERRQIEEKMEKDPVSLEVNRLIDSLSLSAEEIQDERTKYILGHDR